MTRTSFNAGLARLLCAAALSGVALLNAGCPTDDTDDTTPTETDADTDSDADGDTDVDGDVIITFEIATPDVFGWYGVNPPDEGTASVTVNGEVAGETVYDGETIAHEVTVPYGDADTYEVELGGMGITCAPLEFESDAEVDETIEVAWLDDQCAWAMHEGGYFDQWDLFWGDWELRFDDRDDDGRDEAYIDGFDGIDNVVKGNKMYFSDYVATLEDTLTSAWFDDAGDTVILTLKN